MARNEMVKVAKELKNCLLDGGPVCRDQKCSCFKRKDPEPKPIVAKIRATINGEVVDFPSKAACARYFKVSEATIRDLIEGGSRDENIRIEVL